MSRIDALRDAFGGVSPAAVAKVKDHLEPLVQAFVRHAPFAVLATSNANGDCDASPRGGLPGFVKVLDDRTLLVPDIRGNRLFQSYENLGSNPKVGMIFMIPGTEVTVRVNGRVQVLERDALLARGIAPELAPDVAEPDANTQVTQGFLLLVDQAYFHCPRAFQFADLWNTDTIARNATRKLGELL